MTQQQQQKHYKYGHKFYKDFYYCDYCNSWVPKEKANHTKKKIRTYLTCPKQSCYNNRLKTKSKGYKFKSKSYDAEEGY